MSEKNNNQQLLPSFSPTEDDLVNIAISQPLSVKLKNAIRFLQCYEKKALSLSTDGYQVGFSGGKDSVVIKQLCILAGVKFVPRYNNVTIDPPELVRFIKNYHNDVEWVSSGHGHLILNRMVEKMSIPTRMGRWCCSEYKDCCTSEDSVGVVGVRADESAKRSKRWKELTIHSKTGRVILAPICYWTDADVWQFIREQNLDYCSLYDEGWSRLGCVGCPLNPQSQKKEFERWPKYEAMWKEGIRRVWEKGQTVMKKDGTKYAAAMHESPEALWSWWINANDHKGDNNCVFEDMMEGLN